jgi:hypothetical protein
VKYFKRPSLLLQKIIQRLVAELVALLKLPIEVSGLLYGVVCQMDRCVAQVVQSELSTAGANVALTTYVHAMVMGNQAP